MKNNKKHIDDEVTKTLSLLDCMEKQETDAFFYTRLKAQIDKKQQQQIGFVPTSLLNILKPMALAAMIAVNVMMAWNVVGSNTNENDREETIESFAYEFGLYKEDSYSSITNE